jgi:3-oxoacyl-[acyl-carrier protein] reductase
MGQNRKVALITGSAKGLGRMTALTLADQGCDIVINYRNSEAEAKVLQMAIEQKGGRCMLYQADIAELDELQQMFASIQREWGGIDILINNAGPFIRERRMFVDYASDEIRYLMNGNLISVMELDHLVLPYMRSQKWGRIIHFGFGHAAEARGWPHRAVYAAAKVGLVSFTKTLAVEEAGQGITVNMICPGDIYGLNKEKMIAEVEGEIDKESLRGRPGTGEDIARVIAFLCLDQSDFITGNIMDISGGLDPIRTLTGVQVKSQKKEP